MAKIVGNIVGVPNPQPDWNQTDPAKADFIKNKPNNPYDTLYGDEIDIKWNYDPKLNI